MASARLPRVLSMTFPFLGLGQNPANDFILVVFETLQGEPRPSFDRRPKIDAPELGQRICESGLRTSISLSCPVGRRNVRKLIASRLLPQDFEVCITTYELCLIEKSALKKFSFEYIAIDEAHRIKNVDSILSQIVRSFTSRGRLLITGTPLQNNLKELFALLNFICPEIFSDYADLESFLHKDEKDVDAVEEKKQEGRRGSA
jgi:hypothetical protein